MSLYLTYDENDTQYPVSELVDHTRYAQNMLNAPGKFANGKPAGDPVHPAARRQGDQQEPRQTQGQCKAAQPGGWNGKKTNCDEFPSRRPTRAATAVGRCPDG